MNRICDAAPGKVNHRRISCADCPHHYAVQVCKVCGKPLCALHESGYCLEHKPVIYSDPTPTGEDVGMSDFDWMEGGE